MNPILRGLRQDERVAILETMRRRAQSTGLSEARLWELAVDFWAPSILVTPSSLTADAIKFTKFLNAPVVSDGNGTSGKLDAPLRRRARHYRPCAKIRSAAEMDVWTRGEIEKIWDAATTLLQLHGVCFNTLIVARHDLLQRDESSGAREMADLVHEAGQQLRRLEGVNGGFHYIYRHRRTARDGFTTAIICHIPERWADFMLDWIDNFLERRFGSIRDQRAVHVRLTEHRQEAEQVRRHWRLVRGLSASLDPAIEVIHERKRRLLIDILHVPRCLRGLGLPLMLGQRFRVSETIGPGKRKRAAREGMALLSPFNDQAWSALTTGWELREFDDRRRTADKRSRAVAIIDAHWPAGRDVRHDQVREMELGKLRSSGGSNPRRRVRSWRGWWLPECR